MYESGYLFLILTSQISQVSNKMVVFTCIFKAKYRESKAIPGLCRVHVNAQFDTPLKEFGYQEH